MNDIRLHILPSILALAVLAIAGTESNLSQNTLAFADTNTVEIRLANERGEPVGNASVSMELREAGILGYSSTHIAFRHTANGVYESRNPVPSGGTFEIHLSIDAPGHQAYRRILTQSGPLRSNYSAQLSSASAAVDEQDQPVREEQIDPQLIQGQQPPDKRTDVDEGMITAISTSGTGLQNSTIRLTSSAGVPLENANVRLRFENPVSQLGRSVTIDFDHVDSGLYRAKRTPVGADVYRVTVQVRADDHAVMNKIISHDAVPPVRESLNVFHNNYYDRCHGRLGERRHTYPDSPWNDCQVEADRLIESFGLEDREIISYWRGMTRAPHPVFKYAPYVNCSFDQHEDRLLAYKSIFDELIRGAAWTMASAQSSELSEWLSKQMEQNQQISIAALAAKGGEFITGFSEALEDLSAGFEIIGATLNLESAYREGSMDGILMYLAYESIVGQILDRLDTAVSQSESWLSEDGALKYLLGEERRRYNRDRSKNMREMAQAVGRGNVYETAVNIMIDTSVKGAFVKAGLTVATVVAGKAPALLLVAGATFLISDFSSSINETDKARTLLSAALQLDRLLFANVPDRFEAVGAGQYSDEQLTDMFIRLQLGLLYNEARASLYAGDHRTWVGSQLQYSDSGPRNQNQAYELRMVEVSREKSARAEVDLERLAQEIFRRQRIQAPVTERREDSSPSVGDWPRDTETEIVEVTSATGRIWMDRNLGASRAARSSTDSRAYGDLYQWGRAADGHQRRNSPTTSTLSRSDQPGHGRFILSNRDANWDWRSPRNDNLWQGVNGINNPCPPGYRLPTEAEWDAEHRSLRSNNASGAFGSPLKLPLAGYRHGSNGSLYVVGSFGLYWSSSVSGSSARYLRFLSSSAGVHSYTRASGRAVRCLKD